MDELDAAAIVHRPVVTDVADLAGALTDTPMAAVCLLGQDGEWRAAPHGLAEGDVPFGLAAAICGSGLDTVAVADVAADDELRSHVGGSGLAVKACAAAPVVAPDGELAGYLLVMDRQPRSFSSDAIRHLAVLAGQVERHLDRGVEQHHLRDLSVRLAEGERALSESLSRLEVSNRELEHFAFYAAHELQAPLRAVSAFASVLEDAAAGGTPDPDLIAATADHVQSETMRLQGQVAGLLALARVSDGEPPDEVDLVAVLRRVEKGVDASQATVSVDAPENVAVVGTAVALETVFTNLFTNAVRYRHPDRPPAVDVTVEVGDDRVSVAFADNGLGIAPEHLDRVFEAFQRVDKHSEGAGVGLTLCRRIIERFGGTIALDSEPDAGSVFTVELRRA